MRDSGITQLCAKTSNSPLSFEGICRKETEQLCSIDAVTTNGQISVYLPRGDISCKLRASTTLGGIYSELHDLEHSVSGGNYMEAQTRGYETAQSKLNLNLRTTNNKIYIRR